ncbi:MAG: alginate export family protein [Salibacteraceae bacterium]
MRIKNTIKWVGLVLIQTAVLNPVMANDAEKVIAESKKDTGVFTVGAQIRPRFEYRNGFKSPLVDDNKPASFVEQRSRIWFDYKNSKFRLHVNLQDVRMWGSTDQIYKSDPSMFNAYEAYGEYYFNKHWAMKVGRQAIDYDNARFFGNLDWAQQGRSHDAFLVKYKNEAKKLDVHAGVAYNQAQAEPGYLSYKQYSMNNYKVMYYLWAHKKWDKLDMSFVFNNDGREKGFDSTIVNRQTIGLIPTYKSGKWKFGLEAYYQMGQTAGAAEKNNDVSAYFVSFNATYKTDLTPITLGVDYASGNAHDADANTENAWNPLYGTNHKFYGFMDYFYVGNPHGQSNGSTGLIDIYAKTKFTLTKSKKDFLIAHVHYFMSPVELLDMTDATGVATVDAGLGTEIDLVYKHSFNKNVSCNVGYSHMFATESMSHIKNQNNNMFDPATGNARDFTGSNWIWAQINFSTELFNFKK